MSTPRASPMGNGWQTTAEAEAAAKDNVDTRVEGRTSEPRLNLLLDPQGTHTCHTTGEAERAEVPRRSRGPGPPNHTPVRTEISQQPVRPAPHEDHNENPNEDQDSDQQSVDDWTWDAGSEADVDDRVQGGGRAEEDEDEDEDDMATWTGRAAIKGGSETVRMMLLTFGSIGVTFTWGVEMTYCTPYLLSLGLTKGQTSLVWIAGPLSGLIVQPIVGVISDGSKHPWGRRRPFIMSCSVVVALGLLSLGFTKEMVGIFVAENDPGSGARLLTIAIAVLALYTTDFAINAVMSCSRSLIVDTLPIQKQQSGAAWASRMASIGHIIGYGAGAVDLISLFGTSLGDTQFKQLTLIAALGILACSGVTCWAVSERVLVSSRAEARRRGSIGRKPVRFKVVRQIWSTLLTLPPRIQAICWAVFWSWIGWYPFLIYSSTWVGETYFRYDVPENAKDSKDALGDMGRIGSYALTVYSIITFLGAWILPVFVRSPDDDEVASVSTTGRTEGGGDVGGGGGTLPMLFQRFGGGGVPPNITLLLARFSRVKPDLLTVWFVGHLMFAASMSLAPLAASFRFATALVAFCGIPWTIAMWAPTAFMGVEVNRLTGATGGGGGGVPSAPASYRRLSTSSLEMGPLPNRQAADGDNDDDDEPATAAAADPARAASSGGELSGIYFGILNIYTTLPQFVGTFISAVVFAVLEPGKSPELSDAHPSEHHGTDGPNAIAICLFIGAISSIGAAYATRRLRAL